MLHELAARPQRPRGLVDPRRPRARGACAGRRGARPARLAAARPRARLLQRRDPAERRRAHAAAGRLSKEKLGRLGVPADANAYICGPAAFMADMRVRADRRRASTPARIHTELFGALPPINPGVTGQTAPAAAPAGRPAGNRAAGHVRPQRPLHAVQRRPAQPARTRRRLRRPQPLELPDRRLPHLHHAAAVRRHHATRRTRWSRPPTARCSSAAPSPGPTSSWTCSRAPGEGLAPFINGDQTPHSLFPADLLASGRGLWSNCPGPRTNVPCFWALAALEQR